MFGRRDPGEGGGRLTLAAGDHQHPLLSGELQDLVERQQQAIRRIEIPQVESDSGVLLHAAPGHRDFAAVLLGGQQGHVDAADIRGEGGDDDLAPRLLDHRVHLLEHDPLRGGAALGFDADGVGEERQNALVAETAQSALVRRQIHHRRGIELEVGRIDDRPDRRMDRDRVGVRDRVGDVDRLDRQLPQVNSVALAQRVERDQLVEAVLEELAFDKAEGQG